jgi:hypothetical protein
MVLIVPFVALLAFPLAASAAPLADTVLTMPLSKRGGHYSAKDILAHDRARAAGFNARGSSKGKRTTSVPITNNLVFYSASVSIGQTSYELLIDTGSSNTFVSVCSFFAAISTDWNLFSSCRSAPVARLSNHIRAPPRPTIRSTLNMDLEASLETSGLAQ